MIFCVCVLLGWMEQQQASFLIFWSRVSFQSLENERTRSRPTDRYCDDDEMSECMCVSVFVKRPVEMIWKLCVGLKKKTEVNMRKIHFENSKNKKSLNLCWEKKEYCLLVCDSLRLQCSKTNANNKYT